jgi:Ran GTPase-activating protein (RanGAP) involved in mRNA processing and transport
MTLKIKNPLKKPSFLLTAVSAFALSTMTGYSADERSDPVAVSNVTVHTILQVGVPVTPRIRGLSERIIQQDKKFFLSYCWKKEYSTVPMVDDFERFLRDLSITSYYRDLRLEDGLGMIPGTNIDNFMEKAGQSDAVVIFLNDAYLYSRNCMYEFLQVWDIKAQKIAPNAFVICHPDFRGLFGGPKAAVPYLEHWREEVKKLRSLELTAENRQWLRKEEDHVFEVYGSISSIIHQLSTHIQFDYQQQRSKGFEDVFKLALKEKDHNQVIQGGVVQLPMSSVQAEEEKEKESEEEHIRQLEQEGAEEVRRAEILPEQLGEWNKKKQFEEWRKSLQTINKPWVERLLMAINSPGIATLNLNSSEISIEGAQVIGQWLATNMTLTGLHLYDNHIGIEGARAIGQGLATNTTLTILSLASNKIGNEGTQAIGQGLATNTTLTNLMLGCNKIGTEGARAIGQWLATNTDLRRLELNLMGNEIDTQGAQVIGQWLSTNTPLAILTLSHNNIGDEGAQVIGHGLATNTTLTMLSLDNNNIGTRGARAIGQGLAMNTTLTMLNLHYNPIGNTGSQAIGQGLATNTTLTTLYLYGNQIGDEGVRAIRDGLATNRTLTNLCLHTNQIGDEGAQAIGQMLETNKILTTLHLGRNQIRAEGARAIGQGLATNTTLTNLNLGWNKIGDEGSQAIGQGLLTNTTLTILYLNSNEISAAGTQAIRQRLATNTTLTTLYLEEN